MSHSFSVGARAILPLAVTDIELAAPVNNVFNPVIGGGTIATAFPAGLLTGSMSAVLPSFAAALDLENMLAGTARITWVDTDTALSLVILADQEIRIVQGDDVVVLPDGTETYLWSVTFSFQQVV